MATLKRIPTAELLTPRKVSGKYKKSIALIYKLSGRHDWANRAAAWDEHVGATLQKAVARKAVSVTIAAAINESGDRILRIIKERDEWLQARKQRATKIARQGEYLLGFPAKDEIRETPDGPIIIKAANPSIIRNGARMCVIADTMMASALREELSVAAYSPEVDAPLPHLDTARAIEVRRLDIFTESLLTVGRVGSAGGFYRIKGMGNAALRLRISST